MNSAIKMMKSTALLVGLSVAYVMAGATPVAQNVTVDEGVVTPGATPITMNQLIGGYSEVLTFTDATHFTTEAIFNTNGWSLNGNPVSSYLNGPGASGYKVYAKFTASGTYNSTPAPDTANCGGAGQSPCVHTDFTATNNYLELWIDPNADSAYTVASSSINSVNHLVQTSAAGTTADDRLLATASMTLASGGNSDTSTIADGNFEIIFGNFTLTTGALSGDTFFTAPRPFYMGIDLNGNFQDIVPVSGTSALIGIGGANNHAANSANAFFFQPVPEPASLALVGVALLGLGVVGKRRKS